MLKRKTTNTFFDDCVNVILESDRDHEDVTVEELTCVLENILDDVLTRLLCEGAEPRGQSRPIQVAKATERSESKGGWWKGKWGWDSFGTNGAHPLDDVLMKEPNLGSFLVACFEDLVDRVDAKPTSEEGDEADNGDMASMEALMKLMDGAGGDDGEDVVKGIAAL